MTVPTDQPLDPDIATAARDVAVRAAQRCSGYGATRAPRKDGQESLVEFRDAVEAYVIALKANGRPPEITVLQVKQIIAEVEVGADTADLLRREAVRWAIDAYFAS